ncbi:hypothetical protein [Actinobaculum suis]|uniref:hypothetical protein n=1 Tax=Actinobaculum suis TaxID=1657 RepID=UPI000828B756|nr:hypothetical protein [Actinobaculum suis]OCA93666.1 hypothetical protein ACU20_08435 [Actinobaculum suis]
MEKQKRSVSWWELLPVDVREEVMRRVGRPTSNVDLITAGRAGNIWGWWIPFRQRTPGAG